MGATTGSEVDAARAASSFCSPRAGSFFCPLATTACKLCYNFSFCCFLFFFFDGSGKQAWLRERTGTDSEGCGTMARILLRVRCPACLPLDVLSRSRSGGFAELEGDIDCR